MKKIIMVAAVVGLGLGVAKASTNILIERTLPAASFLKASKTGTKATTTVCHQVCDLNGKCYTECSVTQSVD